MSEKAPKACTVTLNDAGLPNRSERAIARDAGRLRAYAHYLAGTSARGRSETIPDIDYDALKEALKDDDPDDLAQAAFIAGRCAMGSDKRERKVNKRLGKLAGKKKATVATVEAAMALVLRGDKEQGAASLRRALEAKATAAPWQAAAYLAQTGDASGWDTIAAMAKHGDAEVRVDTLEASLDFLGVDTKGVHELLANASADASSEVRQAVPALLVEAAHPDAKTINAKLAESDSNETVRLMARTALGTSN